MEEQETMTLEEAARYARVPERTLDAKAKQGEIPCVQEGPTWRFSGPDLNKWIEQRLGGPIRIQQENSAAAPLTRIREDEIVLLSGMNKAEVLDTLLEQLYRQPEILDPEALRKGIYHREELMSTGIGQGIAVPHVRLESIRKMVLAFGVSVTPIPDYVSLDDQPVHLVFMIAAGRNQHADHIRLLSSIAGVFKEKAHRERILAAPDSKAVLQTIPMLI